MVALSRPPELQWNYKHILVRSFILVGQPVDLSYFSLFFEENIYWDKMIVKEDHLQRYLATQHPKENGACEWKEFKNLTHAVTGRKGEDAASYVSAIANMNGGHLVIGVEDKTLRIVGIQNFHNIDNICPRLIGVCTHLNSENFRAQAYVTNDTGIIRVV